MSKTDPLSGALSKSLQDEDAAVDQRFARAESVLGGRGRGQAQRHAKQPAKKKRSPVIRDTFSFPEFDYALLSEVQQRCLTKGQNPSKSELVRAGLKVLASMKPADLVAAIQSVEKVKTGRAKTAA